MLGLDDLIPDGGRLLERVRVGDGVDQHEGVGRRYGQRAHGRELVRAGRVQYVQVDFHALHGELAVVHLLDGALVLGRELAVQELSDQRRFADARRAHHHDLVPRHVRRIRRRRRRRRLQLVMVVVMAARYAPAANTNVGNVFFYFTFFFYDFIDIVPFKTEQKLTVLSKGLHSEEQRRA